MTEEWPGSLTLTYTTITITLFVSCLESFFHCLISVIILWLLLLHLWILHLKYWRLICWSIVYIIMSIIMCLFGLSLFNADSDRDSNFPDNLSTTLSYNEETAWMIDASIDVSCFHSKFIIISAVWAFVKKSFIPDFGVTRSAEWLVLSPCTLT